MHRRPPHILFILAIVFAIAAPAAAHNRVNAIAPQPIELFRETASVDRTPFDEDVLLRSALETVLPPSEPIASLAETRIRDFGDLAPFEREERGELTRALHQSYEQLNEKSASVESFCAGDPINGRDPLGEGILDDIKSELKQQYTDLVTHAAVTGKAIKGIAKSVGKTIVGVAATVNLLHEASKPGNVQAQLQVVDALKQTHDAVAEWGTSAGYAIAEPEQIQQAVNELQPDEFAEEVSDATILTASFVTPLEGVGAEAEALEAAGGTSGVNLARPKTIQPRPTNVRFGPPRGGGGNGLARAYASQVTNGAEKAIYVNGVEFEGVQQGILVDAKRASGTGSFYDISGADRFTRNVKIPKVLNQAQRQLASIQGEGFKGIRWEVADAGVAQQLRRLFAQRNIRITVVHNPALQ